MKFIKTNNNIMTCFTKLLIMAAMTGVLVLPAEALADEVTVPADGSASSEVEARFTIDEDVLNSLGYNCIASIPINLPLVYNDTTGKFSNTASIYCSGILPAGKQAQITINQDSSRFGNVYDPDENAASVKGKTGFSVNLSKSVWTKQDCLTNLSDINESNSPRETGTLSVSVPGKGFIPSSTGTYTTYIPLIISEESSD